jgi:hypothetical protein
MWLLRIASKSIEFVVKIQSSENAWEHLKVRHIVELCLGVWCFHGNSMYLFPLGEQLPFVLLFLRLKYRSTFI